jgi:putative flippase GtrA
MGQFNANRNLKFLIVGALGVVVNYLIFTPFRERFSFNIFIFHIDPAWFAGIAVAAEFNYLLNEYWTYKKVKQ